MEIIKLQRIIQEFNLGVDSHVMQTLQLGGLFAVVPPYFPIYQYFATYTIFLYILLFKTMIFFPKFSFHWYGS